MKPFSEKGCLSQLTSQYSALLTFLSNVSVARRRKVECARNRFERRVQANSIANRRSPEHLCTKSLLG